MLRSLLLSIATSTIDVVAAPVIVIACLAAGRISSSVSEFAQVSWCFTSPIQGATQQGTIPRLTIHS